MRLMICQVILPMWHGRRSFCRVPLRSWNVHLLGRNVRLLGWNVRLFAGGVAQPTAADAGQVAFGISGWYGVSSVGAP